MSKASLDKAEKIEYSETPTEGDIADFHNQNSDEDLNTFMRGDNYTNDDDYSKAIGISSENYEEPKEVEYESLPRNTEPTFKNVEDENYKKLYGVSENEKGELRRSNEELRGAVQELLSANKQLLNQVNNMQVPQVQPPNFFNTSTHQYQQPQNSNNSNNYYNPYLQELAAREDDDMVSAKDMKALIGNIMAPMLDEANQRISLAEQRAMEAQQANFNAQKQAYGITPQLEAQILSVNPWMKDITNPGAYLNAMQNAALQIKNQQLVERAQPKPLPSNSASNINDPNRKLSRRMTYIESGNSTSNTNEVRKTPDQMFNEKVNEIYLKYPYGHPERTRQTKELMKQMGVGEYSGFRDPMVLTRR